LYLAPAVLLSTGAIPEPAFAIDPAFEAVRDAIIHLGLGDVSKVQLDKWIGTGFLVDNKCTVMTAKHVIDGVDKTRLLGAFQLPGDRTRARFLAAEVIDNSAQCEPAAEFGQIGPVRGFRAPKGEGIHGEKGIGREGRSGDPAQEATGGS
jgi:hypothetical protein